MAVSRRAPAFSPDPNQQHAIEHVSGPMLVVAGAGTGKTTVLTRRIARLVERGHARPDEILAVTYTLNAANEMRQRVQAELGKAGSKGLQVETFHAFCNNLLIAEKRDFNVLDDKQLWIFLRRNIRDLRLNYYVRAANTAQFLDHLLEFTRRCHDELVGPEQYAEYVRRVERGELPVPRVSKSKDAEELSDEEVLGRCREIAFVFVTVEGMLRERNFGTFSHQILRANDLLASDPALLERTRAHAIIAENPEFSLQCGTEQYRRVPLTSARDEEKTQRTPSEIFEKLQELEPWGGGFVSARGAGQIREEISNMGIQPVQAVLVTSSFMEANDLVSTLMERTRTSRCDWKDIGILYRIHSHRDEVAAELAKNGIPFSIEGLDVLDSPEIRDLLSCLGAVVSTGDSAAWLRVAALRQFSVDPDQLRSALKALPRDSAASVAFVLPKLKGGAALLESVEQA